MALILAIPQKESFYSFVRWTLFICRCVGLLPISGLWSGTSEVTRGTLKSWYSLVYIPTVIIHGISLVFIFLDLFDFHHQVEAVNKFIDFLMYCGNFLLLLTLLRISLRWQITLKEIEIIEKLLPPTNHFNIVTYTEYLSVTIMVISVVDTFLHYTFTWQVIENCFFSNGELDLETYLMMSFDCFFDYLPFNYVVGIVLAITKFQKYFLHCFSDVLIIITSIYLYSKFAHFNHIIAQKHRNSTRNCPSWSSLQIHYTRISRLVTIVDNNINHVVLLSFFINLLLIFQQIFFITNNLIKTNVILDYTKCSKKSYAYTTEAVAYLIYSCFFALLRTLSVSLFASNFHIESRKPLDALHEFPSLAYNSDMKRLMTQVYYSSNCLTGCRLFSVTRGMVLAMLATVVTYELVLFQL